MYDAYRRIASISSPKPLETARDMLLIHSWRSLVFAFLDQLTRTVRSDLDGLTALPVTTVEMALGETWHNVPAGVECAADKLRSLLSQSDKDVLMASAE